jgi:hypothetical protein
MQMSKAAYIGAQWDGAHPSGRTGHIRQVIHPETGQHRGWMWYVLIPPALRERPDASPVQRRGDHDATLPADSPPFGEVEAGEAEWAWQAAR